METNNHDNDFDAGFDNWMASAAAYKWYEEHGKPIPQELKSRRAEANNWLNGLSDEDYDRLIH